mgnify:FL=1
MTVKQASDAADDMYVAPDGAVYSREKLAQITQDHVEAYMGPDIAAMLSTSGRLDFEKLAEAAPALPKPDMEELSIALNDGGAKPVAKLASFEDKTRKSSLWATLAA